MFSRRVWEGPMNLAMIRGDVMGHSWLLPASPRSLSPAHQFEQRLLQQNKLWVNFKIGKPADA